MQSAFSHSDDEGFWTEGRFRIATYVGTGVAFLLLAWLRFGEDPRPPRMPRAPTNPRAADVDRLNFSQGIYQAALERDAVEYGANRITSEELSSPFPREAVDLGKELAPGDAPIETATLRLSTRQQELEVDTARGSFTSDHLVLRIENKTDRYLAYRIDTSPSSVNRCLTKGDIPHDAIALAPHETAERTECVWRDKMRFVVDRVETMTIPSLSYYYVSRLYPPHIGLDGRATRRHRPPKGQVCSDIPEQTIRRGMQKGETSWRDVIDFYARHDCANYLFPPGYRAFETKGQYALPVSRDAPLAPPPSPAPGAP